MSSKPTGSLAMTHLWCESAPTRIVVPSTAKQQAGWATGERPPAQYENWWANRVDTWLKYLSDGAFTGGITADTLAVTGNETVGGTLGVTGATSLAAVTASGLVTASAGLTAGANQHVTLSGTGKLKHGIKTLTFPAGANEIFIRLTSPGRTIAYRNIEMPVGVTIDAVRVVLQDSATGPTTLAATFNRQLPGVNDPSPIAIGTSSGSGAVQTLSSASGLGIVVGAGSGQYYSVWVFYASGAANADWSAVEVDYFQG